MSRLPLPLLVLFTLGCVPVGGLHLVPEDTAVPEGDTDTDTDTDGDSDADSDTDADTDVDSYFHPDYLAVHAYIGVQGNEISDWGYSGHVQPSYAFVMLAQELYFDTQDEQFACFLYYEPVGEPSTSDSLLSWQVEWLPIYASDNCYNLDPDYYGSYPIEDIGVSSGSITVDPLNDYTEELLEESYGIDYFDDKALGVETHLGDFDDYIEIYWDYYPELQLYQGWAYEVGDDGECDFEHTLSPRDLGGRTSAVLAFGSLYYEAPDAWL
jgi:hypothetical protein